MPLSKLQDNHKVLLLHRPTPITLAMAFYCNDGPPFAVKPRFATRSQCSGDHALVNGRCALLRLSA